MKLSVAAGGRPPVRIFFLTICTKDWIQGLHAPVLASDVIAEALRLEEQSHWSVRTMTVMPDHVHLLVQLGADTPLSHAIRLFKGRLAPTLRASNLHWERGCFDHRLRDAEDRLPVFLYIFLNPYRSKLVGPNEPWPGYYCHEAEWSWFGPLTNSSCPMPEWLL
jgi:putative transposase